MSSDNVTLTLPRHAARLLCRMCKHERNHMMQYRTLRLQVAATYDSLDCIESAIPSEIWDEFHASS